MITVITGNIHLIIFYLPGPFATLMKKADSFMQKFSLRRLKMGTKNNTNIKIKHYTVLFVL
jgi:hypothetical protein